MTSTPSRALIDNWGIELALSALRAPLDSLSNLGVPANCRFAHGQGDKARTRRDAIESLITFFDAFVLFDQIVFDEEYAFTWRQPFSHLLPQLDGTLTSAESLLPDRAAQPNRRAGDSDLVADGLDHYLALAQEIETVYWPCPRRATLLESWGRAAEGRAAPILTRLAHRELDAAYDRIVAELNADKSSYVWAGFGSVVLADCDSRDSVLTAAMQLRGTKEAAGFRRWLAEFERALQKPDLRPLSDACDHLRDVLADIDRLGRRKEPLKGMSLVLGFGWPQIEIDSTLMSGLLNRFLPKKPHVTFLRGQLSKMVGAGDMERHLDRLFGDAQC